MTNFRKGDKVLGLRKGSTPWTDNPIGTVTGVSTKNGIRVQWDRYAVEDDMDPADLCLVVADPKTGRWLTIPAD